MTDAPIACTLRAGDFKARLASIAAGHDRNDLTLVLRYDRTAAVRVHEMVQRERECCAFLDFDISEDAGSVAVRVSASEQARVAAQTLFEQFLSGRADASACGCQ